MNELTVEQLQQILPKNKNIEQWYESLSKFFPEYEMTTNERIASFLAQCGHESLDFTVLKENLNYSAQGLANTWPSRYSQTPKPPYTPNALALQIQRNPEAIANNTYANRMGNGDVASGDGWRYRGQGLIQLTGKQNYSKFADAIGMDLSEVPDYLSTCDGAVHSACWFWQVNNLNRWADQGDVKEVTRRINGGYHGLEDRTNRYNRAMQILGA